MSDEATKTSEGSELDSGEFAAGLAAIKDQPDASRSVPGGLHEAFADTASVSQPTTQEQAPPEVSASCYEVLGVFAKGGQGRILQARDKRLKRPVALKELLTDHSGARERFLRESFITARLQHPGIVPIYELGSWPTGELFYSMKMVAGTSLDAALKERTTFAARMAMLPRLIDVAEAVAYAHSQDVIHRDLKPDNILCGEFGETIVIDWGLAKLLSEKEPAGDGVPYRDEAEAHLTSTGAVLGTAHYMPPEQAKGLPVDKRADVYSLGVILYQLLSGTRPYSGKSTRAILIQIVTRTPPPLELVAPETPPDLLAIVNKAMAREAKDRYESAKELADDLKKFQAGQLVGVYQYSPWELIKRWLKKHQALVTVSAAALLLLSVVGGVLLRRVIDESARADKERDTAVQNQQKAETLQRKAEEEKQAANENSNQLVLEQASFALDDDPLRALLSLKKMIPDAKGWEEAYQIAQQSITRGIPRAAIIGHGDASSVEFSPDGKTIATAGLDGYIQLWDVATKASRELPGAPTMFPRALRFSPDGRLLASIEAGGVRLWELATETNKLLPDNAGNILSFSSDGRHLAFTGSDSALRLYSIDTGELRRLVGHKSNPKFASFSQDGQWLVSTSNDETIRVWSVVTGKSKVIKEPNVNNALLLPDNKTVVSCRMTGEISAWDVDTGQGQVLQRTGTILAWMALSPDGKRVAVANAAPAVWLWELETNTWRTLTTPINPIVDLGFSPDGRWLVAAHTLGPQLWDLDTGESRILFGHTGPVQRVAFSPDSSQLASASDGQDPVFVWSVNADADTNIPREPNAFLSWLDSLSDASINKRNQLEWPLPPAAELPEAILAAINQRDPKAQTSAFDALTVKHPESGLVWGVYGYILGQGDEVDKAIAVLTTAAALRLPNDENFHRVLLSLLARALALKGEPAQALSTLEQALEGWSFMSRVDVEGDPAFSALHRDPRFEALLKKLPL